MLVARVLRVRRIGTTFALRPNTSAPIFLECEAVVGRSATTYAMTARASSVAATASSWKRTARRLVPGPAPAMSQTDQLAFARRIAESAGGLLARHPPRRAPPVSRWTR